MAPEAPSPAATAALAGLTVLDSTLALAGPFATFLLAALGARVIKIEHPQAPDPCRENPPFLGPHDVERSGVQPLARFHGVLAVEHEPHVRQAVRDEGTECWDDSDVRRWKRPDGHFAGAAVGQRT